MLEIILGVLALIAIVAASIYFYNEMKDHKSTNNSDFEKINKNIEEEEKTRLGNIKYVVNEVNRINKDMDTEYMAEIKQLKDIDTGFGKLIMTGSDTSPTEIRVTADPQQINLMKHVSMVGGMSIKDLQGTASTTLPAKQFKACGTGTGVDKKCIEFPNSEGDTYLTGLNGENSSVVSGSLFKANIGAHITGILKTDTINNLSTASNLTIENVNGRNVIIKSGDNKIEVTNAGININTISNDNTKITINSQTLTPITLTTSSVVATDLAGKTVLTLVNPAPL